MCAERDVPDLTYLVKAPHLLPHVKEQFSEWAEAIAMSLDSQKQLKYYKDMGFDTKTYSVSVLCPTAISSDCRLHKGLGFDLAGRHGKVKTAIFKLFSVAAQPQLPTIFHTRAEGIQAYNE